MVAQRQDAARLSELTADPIRPLDAKQARAVSAALKDWGRSHSAVQHLLSEGSAPRDFVVSALSLSPFLFDTAGAAPGLLAEAIDGDLRAILREVVAEARAAWQAATEAELMTQLRQLKRRAAFVIAL
eukprot:gene46617-63149_t